MNPVADGFFEGMPRASQSPSAPLNKSFHLFSHKLLIHCWRASIVRAWLVLIFLAGCTAPGGVDQEPSGRQSPEAERFGFFWPDASEATIRPGVRIVQDPPTSPEDVVVQGALEDDFACTSNFLFRNETSLFLGTASHCTHATFGAGPLPSVNGDPCELQVKPAAEIDVGDEIAIEGASKPGRLAYSSLVTMFAGNTTDPAACSYNDFALVEIHAEDHGRVHPSVLGWGGPYGMANETQAGSVVRSYGQSPYRPDAADDAREAEVLEARPWSIIFGPGTSLPGDSGGPLLTAEGLALGAVIKMQLYCAGAQLGGACDDPTAASSVAVPLQAALQFMEEHAGIHVQLVQTSA